MISSLYAILLHFFRLFAIMTSKMVMVVDKGEIIMKKWFKAFAVMGACAFMLGTMGVASADEYEGYDEDGNYVYAVTDEQGNVAVAVADADGNYAVVAEGADGSSYQETGSY